MANNPYLQQMFDLEADLEGAGGPVALGIDAVLMKLEDGVEVTDDDWGRILLYITVAEQWFAQVKQSLIQARAESSLEWHYDA